MTRLALLTAAALAMTVLPSRSALPPPGAPGIMDMPMRAPAPTPPVVREVLPSPAQPMPHELRPSAGWQGWPPWPTMRP
jgi:hypothetical protein